MSATNRFECPTLNFRIVVQKLISKNFHFQRIRVNGSSFNCAVLIKFIIRNIKVRSEVFVQSELKDSVVSLSIEFFESVVIQGYLQSIFNFYCAALKVTFEDGTLNVDRLSVH